MLILKNKENKCFINLCFFLSMNKKKYYSSILYFVREKKRKKGKDEMEGWGGMSLNGRRTDGGEEVESGGYGRKIEREVKLGKGGGGIMAMAMAIGRYVESSSTC